MRFQEVEPARPLLVDFDYDAGLRAELRSAVRAAGVETAWVTGTGALREAEIGVYDQDDYEVHTVRYDEPLEMPGFAGTITTDGDGIDVQVRGVLARPSGQALAGRLVSATVFGGQALVRGFEEPIDRETDAATGMDRLAL
ncbi:MAG: PPC domain-containing DNA-binding protein [Halodesulfurarchaeum sp.]